MRGAVPWVVADLPHPGGGDVGIGCSLQLMMGQYMQHTTTTWHSGQGIAWSSTASDIVCWYSIKNKQVTNLLGWTPALQTHIMGLLKNLYEQGKTVRGALLQVVAGAQPTSLQ